MVAPGKACLVEASVTLPFMSFNMLAKTGVIKEMYRIRVPISFDVFMFCVLMV